MKHCQIELSNQKVIIENEITVESNMFNFIVIKLTI